ncbi:hypothetical protein C8Q78DRAFT_996602 [Trametes maxima]|nr:hypothetical protein C8Q78DRAFT_996602 [Trametes maxima]
MSQHVITRTRMGATLQALHPSLSLTLTANLRVPCLQWLFAFDGWSELPRPFSLAALVSLTVVSGFDTTLLTITHYH